MTFDAGACECAKEEDRTRMLAVIEFHPGHIQGFNRYIRVVAAAVLDLPRERRPVASGAWGSASAATASSGTGRTNVMSDSASEWVVVCNDPLWDE